MTTPAKADLTSQELQVLAQLADGDTLFEAARALGLTTPTVEGSVRRAKRKLHGQGCYSTTLTLALAYTTGVLDPPQPQLHSPRALSGTERAVLRHIVQGGTARQAASELGLPERTFHRRSSHLRQRLGARTPPHLVTLAWRLLTEEPVEVLR
ncbi:LuxR C-terminal-related transcriptional regulator [Streptomyces qinglanensis]|uniref:LuxR C-terminal-related transcriptional regulator n=1 Tax=Streptomyces qinglanensis TaxID=943816 RepID=UPI003D716939